MCSKKIMLSIFIYSCSANIANWSEPSAHELISGRWFFVAAFRRKRLLHLVFILLAAPDAQKRNSNKNLRPRAEKSKSKSPEMEPKKNSANEKLHLPVGFGRV